MGVEGFLQQCCHGSLRARVLPHLSLCPSAAKAPHFSRLGDVEVNAGQNATFQCVAAGKAAEAERFLMQVRSGGGETTTANPTRGFPLGETPAGHGGRRAIPLLFSRRHVGTPVVAPAVPPCPRDAMSLPWAEAERRGGPRCLGEAHQPPALPGHVPAGRGVQGGAGPVPLRHPVRPRRRRLQLRRAHRQRWVSCPCPPCIVDGPLPLPACREGGMPGTLGLQFLTVDELLHVDCAT